MRTMAVLSRSEPSERTSVSTYGSRPIPRKIMDDHDISWQTAELGKVDVGGGGTIAYICALYGMEVIDSGVAVLSMHAPMEIISKADLYEARKAYKAFMLNA